MAEKKTSTKKKTAPTAITPAQYDIILGPHITEKATNGSAFGQVTFRVALNATKPQIKSAVENLFKVSVTGVNTLRVKGKLKRFKGRPGQRSDYKKAVVTLKEGQTIDMATGI
ncbi:MAG: 50S ribosomal protein L23 [Alphaproteobacteria bacterium]